MDHRKTLMETVRQFLAAFADQDRETLTNLLAMDVDYDFDCKNRKAEGLAQRDVVKKLISERARWQKSRIDIKSWQVENQTITLTFHVQYGCDIYTDYLEYNFKLTIRLGRIFQLRMYCEAHLPNQIWPQAASSTADRLSLPQL